MAEILRAKATVMATLRVNRQLRQIFEDEAAVQDFLNRFKNAAGASSSKLWELSRYNFSGDVDGALKLVQECASVIALRDALRDKKFPPLNPRRAKANQFAGRSRSIKHHQSAAQKAKDDRPIPVWITVNPEREREIRSLSKTTPQILVNRLIDRWLRKKRRKGKLQHA